MQSDSVLYEQQGAVVLLTLNEPEKLNALSIKIREGLESAFIKIASDDSVRSVVITGAGEKSFCAGADISSLRFDPIVVKEFLDAILDTLAIGERCKKPVICAVNGYAFGGGLELAIGSDFIIASEKAKFGVPEINIGLLPGFAIVRLGDIIGRQKAKEMAMLGEPISPQEAKELGMVLDVVPHEQVVDKAMDMAKKLAAKPQPAVQLAKAAFNRQFNDEGLNYAKDAMPFLFLTDDGKEGVTAFMEKRKPNFL